MPLSAERVAEVFDPSARTVGSGWFVTPQLVLTVWHAVGGTARDGEPAPGEPPPRRPLSPAALDELARDRARCRVRALADARRGHSFRDAVTVWWRPECDMALLLVTDVHQPASRAGWAPTYWADLTSADPVDVTAVGFPDHDVVSGMRESRQFSGIVHPLSGVRSGQWVITTSALARPTPGSGWAGMSGAALFAGDRLVGIVTADAGGRSGPVAELRAVPAAAFADDPGLTAWIRWAGGAGVWAHGRVERPEPSRSAPADIPPPRRTAASWTSPVRAWQLRRRRPLLPPELLDAAPAADAVRDRGGLSYRAAEPGELARVYTQQYLDTTTDRDAEGPAGPPSPGSEGRHPLRVTGQPVSVGRLLTDPTVRHIVVTGQPGVGKSSLLEHVEVTAWRWWRTAPRGQEPAKAPFGPLLPLRIAARELVGRDSVAAAVRPRARVLLEAGPPVPGARVLVLVDALDEVTRPEDWRQVMELLLTTARESTGGPGMERRLMLSTRSLHDSTWRSLTSVGVTEFRLQPFSDEQLQRFVMAHQTGGADRLADPVIHERAAVRAAEFLAYVRASNVLDLVRLPLLAQLAVGQYFDPGGQPHLRGRRVDLYARAVAEFLGRFPQRQDPYEPWLRDRVEELLGRLRERYARDAPGHASVTTALRGLLGDLADTYLRDGTPLPRAAARLLTGRQDDDDPSTHRTVAALLDATGLVVDVHGPDPRFLHRTFAEYLAAEHFRGRLGNGPDAWGDALADADTRVAALFAFDRQPAELQRELARRLAADPRRVEQAAWLLAEGMCDDETRDRILEKLWQHPDEREPGTSPVVQDWQQTHTALAHLPAQQRRLHDMATDPDSVPIDRVNAAAALAGHDPRGTELLRGFARDPSFALQLRIGAAAYLAHADRETGTELLTRFADDTTSRYCAQAAARLAEHDTPGGTARLRALVAHPHCPHLARVEAAVALRAHDRASGTDWLRRFAADAHFFADCRVFAADALAAFADPGDQERTEATLLLERIARDERVDVGYRVEAAHRLARYDAAGVPLLRDFADGALPGRYGCDAAVLLAQHDREEGVRILGVIARGTGQEAQHRLRAAAELAHYEPAQGEPLLAGLAREPGWDAGPRLQAAVLLARRDREAGLLLLREHVAGATGERRVSAARALAGVDREEGLRLLRELADSPDAGRSVRVHAASAIGDFDPKLKEATLRRLGVDIRPGGWFSV